MQRSITLLYLAEPYLVLAVLMDEMRINRGRESESSESVLWPDSRVVLNNMADCVCSHLHRTFLLVYVWQ